MEFDEQLAMGRGREADWRSFLAEKRGLHVVDVAKPSDDTRHGGPRVRVRGGYLVAPDVLAVDADGKALWFEVKAKSVPSYRYSGRHRGWWHGVDLHHWRHYLQLAERAPVFLVTCEQMTLPRPGFAPPPAPRLPNGKLDHHDFENHLVPGPVWRAISIHQAAHLGREQTPWPRKGSSGWLWPLEAMTVMPVEQPPREG